MLMLARTQIMINPKSGGSRAHGKGCVLERHVTRGRLTYSIILEVAYYKKNEYWINEWGILINKLINECKYC